MKTMTALWKWSSHRSSLAGWFNFGATDVSSLMLANLAQAACPSMAVLLLGHMHGLAAAGEFAFALAVTAPFAQFFSFQIRTLLLTHSPSDFSLAQAIGIRGWLIPPSVLLVGILAWFCKPIVGIWMLARVIDSWAELFQAENQRYCRTLQIVAANLLRLAALLVAIALSQELLHAAILYLVLSLLVLLALDARTHSWKVVWNWSRESIWLRRGLLLGVCLFLQSASSSFPRIFLNDFGDRTDLGLFAALSLPLQTGGLLAAAFGQSLLPRMSKAEFHQILLWTSLPALGAALWFACAWPIRSLLYQLLSVPPSWPTDQAFVALGVAQFLVWPAVFIGHVLSARRLFRHLLIVAVCMLFASLLASSILVPHYGVIGAAYAAGAGSFSLLLYSLILLWFSKSRQ